MLNRGAASASTMMLSRQSQSQGQGGAQRAGGEDDAAVGAQLAALFGGARGGAASSRSVGATSSSSYGASGRSASNGMGSFSSTASRQTSSGSGAGPSTSRVIAPQSPTRHDSTRLRDTIRQGTERLQQEAASARAHQATLLPPASHSHSHSHSEYRSPSSPALSSPPSHSHSRSSARPYVPRPRQPIGFLLEQQARQEREAHARSLVEQGSSLKRDERLKLMEELDLKIGPWEFEGTRAKFEKLEAYSGHSLK